MSPGDVLGSITAAIGFAKELIDINKMVDQAQWKLKIADLTSALGDAKVGAITMQEEIEAGQREIARLRQAFEFRGRTIEKHNMTYEERDGQPVGMPFCPRCIAEDGFYMKLASLQTSGRPSRCPRCKSDYDRQSEYLTRDEAKALRGS